MMEIAVSNIAWTNEEESDIALKLQNLGIKKIEIAPTKIWKDPTNIEPEDAKKYRDWWANYDIEVVAFQSMLFARPDLKIFDKDVRDETLIYLSRFIKLAGIMGAKRLVFGSPKNRQRMDLDLESANEIAGSFFQELGEVATDNDTMLCIEPNAPQYGCDFIINASEGDSFVRQLQSNGIGLHLDTGCMALAQDDMASSIKKSSDILEHFHVSAPMLDRVYDRDDVDYSSAFRALKEVSYNKIVSIEMRPDEVGKNIERVEEAVNFVRSGLETA